jgi:hypothetical protein
MNQEQRNTVDRIMTQAQRQIWVTFRREGIHRYPAAATDPLLATGDEYDVSFLGSPHRHVFWFKVWIDVWHSNRDLEFIQFKRWLESLYSKDVLQLDFKSVEMLADDLYLQIAERYPDRAIWIEISEDGENGCLIKYDLTRPAQSIKI